MKTSRKVEKVLLDRIEQLEKELESLTQYISDISKQHREAKKQCEEADEQRRKWMEGYGLQADCIKKYERVFSKLREVYAKAVDNDENCQHVAHLWEIIKSFDTKE